jgi:hypothetical protein
MSDSSTAFSHFRNHEKVKVSDQEFERRLGNNEFSKGGAPETSGLLRKKQPVEKGPSASLRSTQFHAFYPGVLGSLSGAFFASCFCFIIFCFRPFSLSFLPLSPFAYSFSVVPHRLTARALAASSVWN